MHFLWKKVKERVNDQYSRHQARELSTQCLEQIDKRAAGANKRANECSSTRQVDFAHFVAMVIAMATKVIAVAPTTDMEIEIVQFGIRRDEEEGLICEKSCDSANQVDSRKVLPGNIPIVMEPIQTMS